MEVRHDLNDMGYNDDTDSDCSVKSEEALKSSYPVRPRNYPKIVPRELSTSASRNSHWKGENSCMEVDESLLFIKGLRKANPIMYDLESKRESLEILCQVGIFSL